MEAEELRGLAPAIIVLNNREDLRSSSAGDTVHYALALNPREETRIGIKSLSDLGEAVLLPALILWLVLIEFFSVNKSQETL